MADEKLIDVPELDTMSAGIEEALTESGFPIKNFRAGRVFKTLLMAFLQGIVTLYELLADVALKVFVLGATGPWLDMKALEFGKTRNVALHAAGNLTLSRAAPDRAIKIAKGAVFKTEPGADGEVLRYLSTIEVVMAADATTIAVPIKAEYPGEKYNVPTGLITLSEKYIDGIETITNGADWLTSEGTDEEKDPSLQSRCINVWDLLATKMTSPAYEAAIRDVNGVAVVSIDAQHPRGQGTIDIVIAGVAGAPSPELLAAVQAVIDQVEGDYDDVLLIGATAVPQDITVTIYKDDNYGDAEAIETAAVTLLTGLFTVSSTNKGNKLTRSDINLVCRSIDYSRNVAIAVPAADVSVAITEILVPGTITVTVMNEGDA